MIVIDTDVAIHWRDGDARVRQRLIELPELPAISAVTRAELENGVYRDPTQTQRRRRRLDALLVGLRVLPFDDEAVTWFRQIVEHAGYSRPRTNDRMIAASVLQNGAVLITMNGGDYRDIPGLDLEVWPSP